MLSKNKNETMIRFDARRGDHVCMYVGVVGMISSSTLHEVVARCKKALIWCPGSIYIYIYTIIYQVSYMYMYIFRPWYNSIAKDLQLVPLLLGRVSQPNYLIVRAYLTQVFSQHLVSLRRALTACCFQV